MIFKDGGEIDGANFVYTEHTCEPVFSEAIQNGEIKYWNGECECGKKFQYCEQV